MSFGRSHLIVLLFLTTPMVVGVFYGKRAAANEFEAVSGSTLAVPETTDLRHPVEVYLSPMFLRSYEDVLAALGTTVVSEDRLNMIPPVEYGLGGQLVIERALPIVVRDGNVETISRTWAETVGDLLIEEGLELGERDRVEPAGDTPLELNQTITITRVLVAEVTKTEAIAFATRTEDDSNQPRGVRQTRQKGEKGAKTLTYQVTRENGVEVGRKLIKTEVTKEPVDELVVIGTRVVMLGEGRATWYDPPWSGLTAAHNTLPKGTMVDVVNVKTGKRVTVKINDRGIQSEAIIDLSVEAFRELATLGTGVITVRLEVAG